jgi:hypothetical protein
MAIRKTLPLMLSSLLFASTAALATSPPIERGPEFSADIPLRTGSDSAKAAGVTDADVGDADSFGRNLRWLGLADAQVELTSDCSGITDPEVGCQVLAPAPALTSFDFEDLGHVTLPKNSAKSLLCYWFSPVLNVGYGNPTPAPVVARLNYAPTLTVENPVLATPGLIDPSTGLPFGGRLLTSMTSSERFQVPLPAGLHITERTRDSAVCIAGFLTRKALVEVYGLSPSQADEFFKQPTTVRLNVSGQAQYLDFASLYFGLRIVGD